MTPTQARAFLAVAIEGSFTGAAKRLNVSQPSITAQVGLIEGQYKVELFHRVGRGVRLTPAGTALLPMVRRLFTSVDEATAYLQDLRGPLSLTSRSRRPHYQYRDTYWASISEARFEMLSRMQLTNPANSKSHHVGSGQRDKEKCKIFSHRGRQTADDFCAPSFRGGDPVNNDWCDASWVSTENTNLTQYALQFDVTCTAFDRAVQVLGSGSTNKRGDEREGDDPGSAARQFNALPPAGSSRKSYVRLPKVKYDDVAHVECHAINISRVRDAIRPADSSCPRAGQRPTITASKT
jgi:hypothetical protein